jgi:monoamine oxidase
MDRVLIMGAGAAGLSAARYFEEKGIRFRVLEAKAHPGGRARTLGYAPAYPLGAEFLHGEAAETKQLLSEFDLPFYDFEPDFHVFENGRLRSSPHFWEVLGRVVSRLRPTAQDRSFAEFLRRAQLTRDQRKLSSAFIEGFNAAELDRISANAVSDASAQVSDPKERAMGRPLFGYGALFDALARDLGDRVVFSSPVRNVSWRDGAVRVEVECFGKRKVYRASRLLITVPIGVLQASPGTPGAFGFHPEIPGVAYCIEKIVMGQVVRLTLEFEPVAFARLMAKFEKGFPFVSSPDLRYTTWWSQRPIRWPMITAWAGGDHAVRLSDRTFDERVAFALADLAKIIGARTQAVRNAFVIAYHHDWERDPYARGAYSYPGVGAEKALARLARPVRGTIYFAGEALDMDHGGTVEGAIASGRQQAQKIARNLESRKGRARRNLSQRIFGKTLTRSV